MDEAHACFLSDSYRPTMQALTHLDLSSVPKIFLTATLAPDHVPVLAEYLGISLSEGLLLRSPTARSNHRFQIAAVHPTFVSDTSIRLASLLHTRWEGDPPVRGIIFVRTILEAETLPSDCPFPVNKYHSRMSDEEKDLQLHGWLSEGSPAKWIIATTALLHGVDYPRVDAVIFVGSPYGLYDFVQGAGRAGRSGQDSLIVVIHPTPLLKPSYRNKHVCEEGMYATMETSGCRRTPISLAMDGLRTSCAELPGSSLCDACEGRLDLLITQAIEGSLMAPATTQLDDDPHPPPLNNVNNPPPLKTIIRIPSLNDPAHPPPLNNVVRRPPPPPPSTSLLGGKTAQVNYKLRLEHARRVKDLISRFPGCFSCRINSSRHGPCHESCGGSGMSACSKDPHLPFSCTSLPYKSGWIDWKKAFVYPTDTRRCYFCGLPDGILTTGLHKTELPPPVKCRYADAAMTVAWHVLNTSDLMEAVKMELGFVPEGNLARSFGKWLMEYNSKSEDIRLLVVFSWFCERYFPQCS